VSDDYWTRREKYDKLIANSAVSWHKLYTEEKTKREELEARYNELTKILRKNGKDKVSESYFQKLQHLAKDADEEWESN
jgi:galactokinase